MKCESYTATEFQSSDIARPHPGTTTSTFSTKPSTLAAYAKDLRLFELWGGTVPCDAETVSRYIFSLRSRVAPTTMYRRAMAIRYAHHARVLPSPTDDPALKWTLRQLQLGFAPHKQADVQTQKAAGSPKLARQAKPVTRQLLGRMLDAMHRNALDRRDRALLLLGFFAALNRAQLVAIEAADATFTPDCMIVRLGSGKRQVTVPITGGELCAATAVRKWIAHAALDVEGGPLFRRFDRAGNPTNARLDSAYVSVVLKQRLKAVGIEPEQYSAHSLRRGRLLEAAKGVL